MNTPRHRSSRTTSRWMASTIIPIVLILLSISKFATSSDFTNNGIISLPSFELEDSWETCATHENCNDCYSASHTCHWCEHDNACHVKGSIHTGCVEGATCSDAPTEEDKSCSTHNTCGDCTASSWGCHWCGFDEGCHAVGSVHGCAAGVDCHAINRCQRLEPEHVADGGTFSSASFTGVGPVAKGVLGVILGLVLCCSTMCFGGASFMKCAVDDLMGEPVEIVEDGVLMSQYDRIGTVEEEEPGDGEEEQDELQVPLMQNATADEEQAEEGSGKKNDNDSEILPKNEARLMIPKTESMLMRASGAASVSQLSRVSATQQARPSSIRSMYFGCQICYLFTIFTSIILFIVSMSYAPRHPQYNVCTNELAWKSIVEGMASLKMSASFDLLISIYNPNKFEVDLSNGHGQFHHDGEYVGSFEIPEGKISEKAISDIIVKTTFTPDKWSALSLTSEYYQGRLKFLVDGHAHVKIPALGNYQFDAKFDDIHVNVNDPSLDDTHLCACPGWKRPIIEL